MIGFIYMIRNTINNKVYIGQTRTSVEQRWHEHVRHSKYCDYVINKAIRKYGANKFQIEIIDTCNVDELDEKEIYYIRLFDSTNKSKGYNVSIGGNTPKYPEEALDVEELKKLYTEDLLPLQKIAEKFNTTIWIIRRDLRKANVTIRDRHDSAERVSKIKKDLVEEALKNTSSLRQAAKYAKVSYSTFRKACKYNHIEYNSSTSARQ